MKFEEFEKKFKVLKEEKGYVIVGLKGGTFLHVKGCMVQYVVTSLRRYVYIIFFLSPKLSFLVPMRFIRGLY